MVRERHLSLQLENTYPSGCESITLYWTDRTSLSCWLMDCYKNGYKVRRTLLLCWFPSENDDNKVSVSLCNPKMKAETVIRVIQSSEVTKFSIQNVGVKKVCPWIWKGHLFQCHYCRLLSKPLTVSAYFEIPLIFVKEGNYQLFAFNFTSGKIWRLSRKVEVGNHKYYWN